MKIRFLSLSLAVLLCLLAMTSCSAAAVPESSSISNSEPTELSSEITPSPAFSDVPVDAWYAEAITYCQENNIIDGVGDGRFDPEGVLTRAALPTVLHRMSGSPAISSPPSFTDAKSGAWYANAVSWAAKSNVISGYGDGTFGITDPTTREQAVTILWRYAGSPDETTEPGFSDIWIKSDTVTACSNANRFTKSLSAWLIEIVIDVASCRFLGRPGTGLLASFGFGSAAAGAAWPVTWASILSCSCCRCRTAGPKEPNMFSLCFAIIYNSFCSKRLTPVNTGKT